MNGYDAGLPIEHFIQAITSQLDRAQAALALKARAGLPLTFAVKDLTIDLRAQMEIVGSVVHIRPAAPSEPEASTVRLQLTTVTRPMIEENAVQLGPLPDEPSLRDVLGPDVTEDEERRLEWAGIHNVAQLRDLQRRSGEEALEKFTQVPVARLRAALSRASLPHIIKVTPELPPLLPGDGNGKPVTKGPIEDLGGIKRWPAFVESPRVPSATPKIDIGSIDEPAAPAVTPPLLKIRGINLVREAPPKVMIGGEAVPVIKATEREIVVAPHAHMLSGTLAVEVEPGVMAQTEIQFPQPPSPATAPKNGGAK
jgi:hypothetical protein